MNIISLAISTFISNYIIMAIIRALPFRNKRVWQSAVITLFCLGEIIGYILIFVSPYALDLITILEVIGSIFGVIIGYVASMMIVLDGITLFKSRRLKEFERNLNNKEGRSFPRWILATISGSLGLMLLIYGIITALHYDSKLLLTIIGLCIGAVLFIGVSIYLFISGAPKHKSIRAENLLFLVDYEGQKLLYQAKLSKEFTIEDALGEIMSIYMIDEYGLIITPTNHFIVKGLKLEYSAKHMLKNIQMTLFEGNDFDEALSHFQKYNRKKIILDEQNHIQKITMI
ncbi:MAG: hypothetical protein K2O22_04430, partial [Anaeroplasmataceae bacterium]|nr:hypothetical protein [Anaeroplasmataceae bacterium]